MVYDKMVPFSGSQPPVLGQIPQGPSAQSVDTISWFGHSVAQAFFSKELWRRSGAIHPPTRYGEDEAFLVQLLNPPGTRLMFLDEPLYYYRKRPDSLSASPDRWELDKSLQFLLSRAGLREDYRRKIKARRRRIPREVQYAEFVSLVRALGLAKGALAVARDSKLMVTILRVRGRWFWSSTRRWLGGR